jgi:hypothetical protein
LIDFDQNVIISYPVTQSLQQIIQSNNLASVSETDQTISSIETESSSSEEDTSNIMNLKFRKVYFAVKRNNDTNIMVTASTNGYLNIWNTKTHRDSHVSNQSLNTDQVRG